MAKELEVPIEKKLYRIISSVGILILVLLIVLGSFYTVQAGERGVVLTLGNPQLDAKEPGFHFKAPLAQSVVKIGVQTQKYEVDAGAASKDLQIVSSKIAVNYHLNPESVPTLYRDIGVSYQDRVIAPSVQEAVKASTAQYTAEELITNRPAVKAAIQDILTNKLISRGIVIEDVNIVNFDFSQQFNEAIELKVTAEQKKLQAQNDLERIKVEAQQVEAAAIGQKNARIATAEGEAQGIEIIERTLSKSPKYIEYLATQKWNGAVPNVMTTGAITPFMDVSKVGADN